MPTNFSYTFSAGPLSSAAALAEPWTEGNCRRAVQWWLYHYKQIFLPPDAVLCPRAYTDTGILVTEAPAFDRTSLQPGDILFAEQTYNKNGSPISKSPEAFTTRDQYLIALHTAIFTGIPEKEVWHATAVSGESGSWSWNMFLQYYRPIAARRA